MRRALLRLRPLCLAVAMLTGLPAWADDIGGSVTKIVIDRQELAKALPPDAGTDVNGMIAIHEFGIPQVIIFKPTTRCWKVPSDLIDPTQTAKDLGNAEPIKLNDIALGDRLLVYGQPFGKKNRNAIVHVIVAEVVMDAGPGLLAHHWHPHEMFSLNWQKFGSFSGDGLSMKYTEPHSPAHNFTMSCEEFLGSTQMVKHQGGYYLDVQRGGESFSVFEGGTYDPVLGSQNEDRSPDGKVVSVFQELLKVPCSQGRDAQFRSKVLAVWRASEEAEPFVSIRGDFDLASATGSWKTRVQLPDADRCFLIRTLHPGSTAPPLWTYSCIFRSSTDTYERVVKLVQTALNLEYRPDETAGNVNQVLFSDPSKPAWKVVVTKNSDSSLVMLTIVPLQLAASMPEGLLPSEPGSTRAPSPSSQTSGGSISEEIEKIRSGEHVPFPPIQPIGGASSSASANGMGAFAVRNDTSYTLTVLFSGPTERRVEVVPGGSSSIELLPGSYKVAARVNTLDVSPSYGEHVFDRTSAGVTFYIQ